LLSSINAMTSTIILVSRNAQVVEALKPKFPPGVYNNAHTVYASSSLQAAMGLGDAAAGAAPIVAITNANAETKSTSSVQWSRRRRRRAPERLLERAQTLAWLHENGFVSSGPAT
jgi:mevalonate pyrophosphate decarboxylase